MLFVILVKHPFESKIYLNTPNLHMRSVPTLLLYPCNHGLYFSERSALTFFTVQHCADGSSTDLEAEVKEQNRNVELLLWIPCDGQYEQQE